MSSKLEEKLLEIEKENPISNDEELINAVKSIIDKEEALSVEERDFDLIDEAIEAVFLLNDVDIEHINKRAQKTTDDFLEKIRTVNQSAVKNKKNKSFRLKWLIPIAAVVSLMIVGTVTAYAFGYNIFNMSKDAIVQLVEKVLYRQGDTDIIVTSNVKKYDDFDVFLKEEDTSQLLLPYELPKDYKIDKIRVEDYEIYKTISFSIIYEAATYQIIIKAPQSGNIGNSENKPQLMGNYDVYYSTYDNIHQGEFKYKDNYYSVTTSSYDCLETIIECLERCCSFSRT